MIKKKRLKVEKCSSELSHVPQHAQKIENKCWLK